MEHQAILSEKPPRAVLSGRNAVCPRCYKQLCQASPGAAASGIELWCRRCRTLVMLEL